ncbi:MAG: YebC/PmpR family DNA-binding transcriptional regulator [Candidatus Omnitrophica bacterium]|nr:YebC/PmpR family DNA-binding transcriptional regulator [Candidatus Omnitrophota bacterium]
MSGHSKWKTNKAKKAAADAKKGAMYTKIIKEITVAAREGGGNPETNAKLRTAIARAKEANMPQENIKMAIKRGTGELPGVTYESVTYEGYAPAGVALLIEAITDNKNRTTAEIRNIMSKKNGNLAGSGSVSWMFSMKGCISVKKEIISEDELLSIVLDAGAEDVKSESDTYEIYSKPQDFENVKQALQKKGIPWEQAEITMVPSSTIKLNATDAKAVLALIDALEEHDDVQQVYANFDIPDEIMEQISSGQ